MNDGTTFVVVLDPPIGEGVHDEQIEIVTKLDAAWRPSGRRSVWFPSVPIGAKEDRGLRIYAKAATRDFSREALAPRP